MRLVRFRRLIVALALAGQALVALLGLAFEPAAQTALGRGVEAALCAPDRVHSDGRLPSAGHGRDAAACLTCQSCLSGASPIPTLALDVRLPTGGALARASWPHAERVAWGSAIARSQRARAPPSIG